MMAGLLHTARARRLLAQRSRAAIDATGLESRYVSRYYVWISGGRRYPRLHWPKLTLVCDLDSHLLLSAFTCLGPCNDSGQFSVTVRDAVDRQPISELLGDTGYDAEGNHRLCREELGMDSTLIKLRRKNRLSKKRYWPATPYRREMNRRLRHSDYGQRWQIECAISRYKRRLGSSLRARSWPMQQWEMLLRVLTHNLMLLAA